MMFTPYSRNLNGNLKNFVGESGWSLLKVAFFFLAIFFFFFCVCVKMSLNKLS